MAVFSSVGILGAYCTVICWFPFLTTKQIHQRNPFTLWLAKGYLQLWENFRKRGLFLPILIVAVIFIFLGISKIVPNDNINQLQNTPDHLLKNELWAAKFSGEFDKSRFFLVEGDSADDVLKNEEDLTDRLQQYCDQGLLGKYQAISTTIPSKSRQQENHDILQKRLLAPPEFLHYHMDSLGFSKDVTKNLINSLRSPLDNFITVNDFLKSSAADALTHLWLGETQRGFGSIVLLGQISDDAILENLSGIWPTVHFVNYPKHFSELFQRYRHLATFLVIASYSAIYIILIFRYGLKLGTLVIAPPLFAAVATIAGMGLTGQSLSLFTVLALLLVLGIGIDYTIFFAESNTSRETIMFAILLSASSTILSFGLLSLSETPVLKSFGTTILIGISLSLVLSPIAYSRNDQA